MSISCDDDSIPPPPPPAPMAAAEEELEVHPTPDLQKVGGSGARPDSRASSGYGGEQIELNLDEFSGPPPAAASQSAAPMPAGERFESAPAPEGKQRTCAGRRLALATLCLAVAGAAIGLGLSYGLKKDDPNQGTDASAVEDGGNVEGEWPLPPTEATSLSPVASPVGTPAPTAPEPRPLTAPAPNVDVALTAEELEDGGIASTSTMPPLEAVASNEAKKPTFLVPETTPTEDYDGPTEVDALIIGAGWAGISATKELLDEGISNVLVLEAESYVGGRSRSFNLEDNSINRSPFDLSEANVPLDVGSEWLYVDAGYDSEKLMGYLLYQTNLLDRVDMDDEADLWFTLRHDQFYLQSADGTTKRLGDDARNELLNIWEEFNDFRDNLDSSRTLQDAYDLFIEEKVEDEDDKQYLILILDALSINMAQRLTKCMPPKQ